jgi:hypothetical protein
MNRHRITGTIRRRAHYLVLISISYGANTQLAFIKELMNVRLAFINEFMTYTRQKTNPDSGD